MVTVSVFPPPIPRRRLTMLRSILILVLFTLPCFAQGQKEAIAKFAHLIGDQKKAEKLFADITAVASENGITVEVAQDATSRLLDMGGKPESIPVFIRLSADTAMGVHSDEAGQRMTFFAMIEALPKLVRLKEGESALKYLYTLDFADVPAFTIIAQAFGVREEQIKEFAVKGALSGSDCIDFIVGYCQKRYGGLAKKLADARR
jgi:hypothetical protein